MDKTEGKRERTRRLIVETATGLFIRKNSQNVTLDEIAEEAGIARRTLYNHFETKEALILETIEPIIGDAIAELETYTAREELRIDDLAEFCLTLWRRHGARLDLMYTVDFEDFQEVRELHRRYMDLYLTAFDKIGDLPDGLSGRVHDLAVIVYRCFVPILSRIGRYEDGEPRFVRALHGLISGLGNP